MALKMRRSCSVGMVLRRKKEEVTRRRASRSVFFMEMVLIELIELLSLMAPEIAGAESNGILGSTSKPQTICVEKTVYGRMRRTLKV